MLNFRESSPRFGVYSKWKERRGRRSVKTVIIAVVTAVVTGVGFGLASDSDWRNQPWLVYLNQEEFELCGLDKLTNEELDYLAAFAVGHPVVDYTGSAQSYLLKEGWQIIAVHGAFDPGDADPFHDVLQVAYIGPEALLIRPIFESETLLPGIYLCDRMGSTLDIIAPDGEDVDYMVEEEL